MSKQKQDAQKVEEIDFSGFAGSDEDDLFDATPGLTINTAIEIESIEDISTGLEEIDKAKNKDEKDEPEKQEIIEDKAGEELSEDDGEQGEVEEEEVKPEEKTEEGVSESPIKIFADFLIDKGIISKYSDEEFEDSEAFLVKKVEEQIVDGIEQYKSSLSPEAKEILDAVEAGIPADAILQRNAAIATYDSLTDAEIDGNEALQRSLVRNNLSVNGYSKEVIEKKIKRLEDAGLLAEEAKDAKVELAEVMQHQKQQMLHAKEQESKARAEKFEEWKVDIKKKLDTTTEIIPGLKITDAERKAVHDGLTRFDRDGKNDLKKAIEKDPDFDLKVAYIALGLKWDFSAFDKKAMTSATKKLRASIENSNKMKSSGVGIGGGTKGSIDYDLISKALKQG